MNAKSRKKQTHGGKRDRAGRVPEHGDTPMKVYTVRLTLAHVAMAQALGGDLSAGIRAALEAAKK
jgi:hypothetical protein